MAKYHGTFSCGHEGEVGIIGPSKDRQWKANRHFEGLCPDCYVKHIEEEKGKTNAAALEKAKEMELPELQGSEKQAAWANTLRQNFIDAVEKDIEVLQKHEGGDNKTVAETLDHILTTKTEAKWFIDNREKSSRIIICKIYEEIKLAHKVEIEKAIEKEAIEESTAYPTVQKTPVAATITIKEDKIEVITEKNDEFREIVKGLGYMWDKSTWVLSVNMFNGTIIDRAAELGNKLLNAGFPITILDSEVLDMAISGTYEPECKRWVKFRSSGQYKGWLAIAWEGKDDRLYDAARKIRGSKWDSGHVVVRVEYYSEIQDYADAFGFKFSEGSKRVIAEYQDKLASANTVTPASLKEVAQPDKLKEILESSNDILDDLKED